MGNFGYGGMGFEWVFWLGLIVGSYLLFRSRTVNCGVYKEKELSAKEILKARYAKGEISKEEFDRVLNDISE